ncbi:hypothetical protein J2X86_002441 [Acinetobacter lwoffii]|uniref:Phage tail protein n=1 Tax=Acinetobacter lwoffii TaxID=28090 RepID=A0AAW8LKX0_ACILW|nr:hypothetical protein [Acinetobacter lwoffii]MDR6630386.1 hypothetical protein [Acinetobacter lwoffii]
MQQNFINTVADFTGDAIAAQSLGAAMLQSNGMIVPDAMPEIALLISNFNRPIITNNDAADFNLAGGAQLHVPGAPKTRYEGQWQIIETDFGQATAFAELIMARGGQTDCWVYDGRQGRYMHAHRLTNVALTFEPIDVDSEGVSTIQRVQVSVKYNYYGLNGDLGSVNKIGQIVGAAAGANNILGKAQQLLNTVVAGNTLVNALKGIF